MRILVEYTIASARFEALVKEEGRPDTPILDSTMHGLLARVWKYLYRRVDEEKVLTGPSN
jgi:hypothetical protein